MNNFERPQSEQEHEKLEKFYYEAAWWAVSDLMVDDATEQSILEQTKKSGPAYANELLKAIEGIERRQTNPDGSIEKSQKVKLDSLRKAVEGLSFNS